MPDLAVIVVSWHVRELLRTCLFSLFEDLAESQLAAEVWVVDNASGDGTPELVAAEFPEVHLVAEQTNLGFVRANNNALRVILARQEDVPRYFWLLNPDTEVRAGSSELLLRALASEPQAGVVGPQLLNADGSLQPSAFRFPGLAQLAFDLGYLPARLYGSSLNGRYPRRCYERGKPFQVDHPLGAAMMVRRDAIAQVGLLDEGYWMYCEEIDWCWRMQRAGWNAYCVPRARVVHYGGQSSSQVRVGSFANLWTSRARLYSQHHNAATHRLARSLVRLEMRRRLKKATGEMADACRQVLQAWECG
jgi:N-acetylglucosaminyl-diphospho-decaprenol L-rhamnosyltransferase